MRRRAFLGALSAVVPCGALAQDRGGVRVIGYLSRGATSEALARALAERGYVEGRNLRIEMRLGSGDVSERRARARELVLARPDVLVAWGKANVDALARETRTIPIVCGGTADPVAQGYAATLRRPGGNITGLSLGVPEMSEILVGLMRAVQPGIRRIAVFVSRGRGAAEAWAVLLQSLESVARGLGIAWELVQVDSLDAFEKALQALDPRTSTAYLVWLPDSITGPDAAAALVRRRMPSSTTTPQFARDGVLMNYMLGHARDVHRVAALVDSLLRGASAADTPWVLPDRTTFVLNRKTARAIGIELPAAVLARATEIVD